jgi:hypothetical protein
MEEIIVLGGERTDILKNTFQFSVYDHLKSLQENCSSFKLHAL